MGFFLICGFAESASLCGKGDAGILTLRRRIRACPGRRGPSLAVGNSRPGGLYCTDCSCASLLEPSCCVASLSNASDPHEVGLELISVDQDVLVPQDTILSGREPTTGLTDSLSIPTKMRRFASCNPDQRAFSRACKLPMYQQRVMLQQAGDL